MQLDRPSALALHHAQRRTLNAWSCSLPSLKLLPLLNAAVVQMWYELQKTTLLLLLAKVTS